MASTFRILTPLAGVLLLAACGEGPGETTPGVITSDELQGRESPEGSSVSGTGELYQPED